MKSSFRLFRLAAIVLLSILGSYSQESELHFSVVDETGQVFRDLKAEDIRIVTKSGPLQLTSLRFEGDRTLSVLIMIDASASQERMLPFEKHAAEAFIDRILKQGRDTVAVVKFTGEISLVHDLSSDFTSVKSRIKEIRFEPPPGFVGGGVVVGNSPTQQQAQILAGSTSLFDSVTTAVAAFRKFDSKGSRKVLLLISDGVNTYGEKKLKEAVEASISASVSVFAVGIGDTLYDGVAEKTLRKLTESTGGTAVVPNEKKQDLAEVYSRLEPTLRNRYIAAFVGGKGAFREVSIEVVNPALKKRLRVYSPKGIF